VPLLPLLRDAATRGRRVALTYAAASSVVSDGDAPPRVRVVDPGGLVENAGRWYLLAAHDGEIRTYRVSRIVHAEVLDEPAQLPRGFNLARAWHLQRSAFEERLTTCMVTVAVDPGSVDSFCSNAQFQLAPGTRITRVGSDDGWPMVQLTFRASAAAVALVLGYGGEARLLEPARLRAEVLNRASAALTDHALQRNE